MFIGSPSSAALEKSFSALWQKQQLIANNIANEDTPGYKAKRISFESLLQKEINDIRNARHMTSEQKATAIGHVRTRVYDDPSISIRADGNNVDIVAEQIEFARTQEQYNAVQQKISGYYSNLKYAISGGR